MVTVLSHSFLHQPGEIPGILVVINRDLISLVQDNVAGHGDDLLVISRQFPRKGAYLFKTAVIMKLQFYRFRIQFLQEGPPQRNCSQALCRTISR